MLGAFRTLLPADASGGWRERWTAMRDRLLASPAFQRRAASFPLTRGIARRRARELFDLCAGFVYSQVLLACVRLRLCEMLRAGPLPAAELATRLGMPVDRARRLLDAGVALRLLELRAAQRYGLGPLGAALLGNPGVSAMVEHHGMLYADLRDPVALLRDPLGDTELARFWAYARAAEPGALDARRVADYSALMSASQQLVAHEILDVYPLRRHRCVLDVGGGEGGFLIAAAQRSPRLRLMLFDLPAVAARARERFAAAGLAARASALGGDFLREELPRGADLVSLVRVLHDHDDAAALAILRAVGRALPPGGRLLLAEPMSAERGARPMGDAYFGWYLLAMGSGRPRTPARLAGLLREAGFGRVRALPARQPLLARVLIAHRAGTRSPEVS